MSTGARGAEGAGAEGALGAGACPVMPATDISVSRMSAAQVRIRRLCHGRAAAVNLAHFLIPRSSYRPQMPIQLLRWCYYGLGVFHRLDIGCLLEQSRVP